MTLNLMTFVTPESLVSLVTLVTLSLNIYKRKDLKNKQEQIQNSPKEKYRLLSSYKHIKCFLDSLLLKSMYFVYKASSGITSEIQGEIAKTKHDLSVLCSTISIL